MGLELAEQLEWKLPDVILYPTGGGTGLIGMWKAFSELATMGWLTQEKRPRMYSCQSTGCDPITAAFLAGSASGAHVDHPHTRASGIRVPKALGDFLILQAVRDSGGRAMSAEEDRLDHWMRLATELEGIALCPESAACIGVLEGALRDGHIKPSEQAVVFNTGAMQKYIEFMDTPIPSVDKNRVDWDRL